VPTVGIASMYCIRTPATMEDAQSWLCGRISPFVVTRVISLCIAPHFFPHLHPPAHGQSRTALFAAAAKGFEKTVAVLLAAKANPNLCNAKVRSRVGRKGSGYLMDIRAVEPYYYCLQCSWDNRGETGAKLRDDHRRVSSFLQDKTTPLYIAVAGQHVDSVLALIGAKAEVDVEGCPKNAEVLPPFIMLERQAVLHRDSFCQYSGSTG
jgi:hypothetical protein